MEMGRDFVLAEMGAAPPPRRSGANRGLGTRSTVDSNNSICRCRSMARYSGGTEDFESNLRRGGSKERREKWGGEEGKREKRKKTPLVNSIARERNCNEIGERVQLDPGC